jgi:glycerol-3-phosphate dehydrogenase
MLDQPGRPPLLSVSRGSHIVIPNGFLGGHAAIMVPKTEDGRVIFAIPWQGVVLVGTTDIPAAASVMEPSMDEDEVDYLLRHIAPYLSAPPSRGDILSVFSGLRPLVTGKENKTSKLSREHHIDASASGLITVAGGKWTTYRRMAEDTLDFAIRSGVLPRKKCVTRNIALHGCPDSHLAPTADPYLAEYGSDVPAILALQQTDISLAEAIDPALPYPASLVVYAVRHECARTIEDILSRRTRSLLLNAAGAMRSAPRVAKLMAQELHRDTAWQRQQVENFRAIAQRYYLPPT